MLNAVIVIIKCLTSIERWIDVNSLHLARKLLLQCFQRQQIIAEN